MWSVLHDEKKSFDCYYSSQFLSLCLKITEARMPSSLNAVNMAACADVCRDESVIAIRNQFSLLQ